ncbi:oxidoreductase [Cephaloticoccus primus]|uniref:Oxidoreductase n=1 Tax=Cephaloticoccus primus TaxID=1548207 RepID=A0A139SU63_9BACT|nr:Gfo/Idh/MocA family oxidoreductase [Cephaloticoccus primus]KXU38116.1 oxidoreductase [Cephaloticoccus primus]
MTKVMNVGIMGCGNISKSYLSLAPLFRGIKIVAVADVVAAAAEERAKEFNVSALTPDGLLAAPNIDIIVNLTIPAAHYEVSRKALEAGKHVFSEKPYVLSVEEGLKLAALAREKGLRIGSAPDTILGGTHQYARHLIDRGEVGRITSGLCGVMSHGMESWHPNPGFFFLAGGGPMLDLGPYYVSNLVQLLGPVKRVSGFTSMATNTRTVTAEPNKGKVIPVETPTNIHATLEFAQGAVITLITSWDVWEHGMEPMALFGTEGTIHIPDPNMFGGEIRVMRTASDDRKVTTVEQWEHPLSKPNHGASSANYRCAGLTDMAQAIVAGRPHRCNGDFALHVIDIMTGILRAGEEGRVVEMQTTCERFAPLGPDEARALLAEG